MGTAISDVEPDVDPNLAHCLAAWMQEAIETDVGVLSPRVLALRMRATPLPSWRTVAASVGLPEPTPELIAEARRIADVAAARNTTPAMANTGALR